jgi:outer membrane protein assembly factor BamD
MFQKISNLLLIIIMLVIVSCGDYNKVLKSSDYDYKLKRANQYFEKKSYVRALPLYEELMTVFRGTTKAEEVSYKYAYCSYGLGDYIMAGYEFKNFAKTYPKSALAEEAMYLNANCYYLDSPRYSLDQENTTSALTEMQLFVTMFPQSPKVQDCNELIDKLRLKLQTKAYQNSKLYYDISDFKASIVAFKNLIKDYPECKYIEEAHFMILKSQYLLAINSIDSKKKQRLHEAEKSYIKFIDSYPTSSYLKEAESIYKTTLQEINKWKSI